MKLPFGLTLTRTKALPMNRVPVSGNGGWWPIIREPFTGAWQRNQEIAAEDLMQSPIVYACTTLIANDIGKLGINLERVDSDGIWNAEVNPAYSPVLRRPNRYQNHIQFKQWWVMSKLRFGNAYALKERDNRGVVVALHLLDPMRATPLVAEDGSVFYQFGQDNLAGLPESQMTFPASEIIHDRINPLYHPLVGISPLYAAAIAAGIGLKITGNVANFFGNQSQPGGFLIVPGAIDPETAAELKRAMNEGYTGANAGRIGVLPEGITFSPVRQNATDSQLIETLKWSDATVAAVFHVPAYKVGVGTLPGNNNVEALQQDYYSQCLQSLIEEFEACMDEGLGLANDLRVTLDLDGLLRMDTKTQMEVLQIQVRNAIGTPNEARKTLNRKPIAGGDTVYLQQQDFSIEALAKRDAGDPLSAPPAPAPAPAPVLTDEESADDQAKALLTLFRKEMELHA